MNVARCLRKYVELVGTSSFAKYEKDLASQIQGGLVQAYRNNLDEPRMVSIAGNIVNRVEGLGFSGELPGISTNAIFIHGTKSQVQFDYYGEKTQRELGDLIFIVAVVYDGKKYFERFTITQFKKDTKKLKWSLSSKSSKEQLYLLSRFPAFSGVGKGSLIPEQEHYLQNYSRCLGSYGMLYTPGDFAFVSAFHLASYLGSKRTMDLSDIHNLFASLGTCPACLCDADRRPMIEELLFLWHEIYHRCENPFFPCFMPGIGILGNCLIAFHVYDFVDKYVRCCIGEFTHSEIGSYSEDGRSFLHGLLRAIEAKAQREGDKQILAFVKDFFGHSHSGNRGSKVISTSEGDYEGGGIGIVYTTIDLGE